MKLLEKRTRTMTERIRTIGFQHVRPYGEPRTAFTSIWKRGMQWHGLCHLWVNTLERDHREILKSLRYFRDGKRT